jgi:tRNA-specific 2-thiouridylase
MKVLVAMSGGVDSTVSAYLLKKRGYEVEGVYMKLHSSDSYHKANIKNIEQVCSFLSIDYHILDLQDEFKKWVFDPFIETYSLGETPNPCIACNRSIKFGKLIEFSKKMGFDFLATGHYIKVMDGAIYEGKDSTKDQSYFLSNIDIKSLNSLIFPLGGMLKSEVKKIASSIEIFSDISKQKESSEICFVEDSHLDILKDHLDIDQEGIVVNSRNEKVGHHFGYTKYTIGQRKGFRLDCAHEPHYVLSIDSSKNQITVGKKDELYRDSFKVGDLNLFINSKDEFECEVKVRYRSPKVSCRVVKSRDRATVYLKTPQTAIAPSQVAAFYMGSRVIGSAIILKE